ncbi:MAG: trehalose-phosphatase [Pseudomonadota bacterium]
MVSEFTEQNANSAPPGHGQGGNGPRLAWELTPSADWALFLDVDGTLLEIAEHPDDVHVSDRVIMSITAAAQSLNGALALVSGRKISNLDHLFSPLCLSVAGLHGLERRTAEGTIEILGDPKALDRLRDALGDLASGTSGMLIEDKGRAIAVHYRQAPAAEHQTKSTIRHLVAQEEENLAVIEGKMVVEIKQSHSNKGTAIAAFMKEAPFAGRLPVFVGDDVTDEDGFAVVNEMGGHSIRIGLSGQTAARYALGDVSSFLEWLETFTEQLSGAGQVQNKKEDER